MVDTLEGLYRYRHAGMREVFRPPIFSVAISGLNVWQNDQNFRRLLKRHREFAN